MTWSSAAGGACRAYRGLAWLPLVASLALAGMARAEVRRDVAYGPLPAEMGDLYTPEQAGPGRAAVLMIHGGGWINGSRRTDSGLAAALATLGVVVFNIDYRLARAAQPATHWPAQLVDAQLAVRFLRAHAAEFGIDPDHIGAIGDSAGAQLAVFLGVLPRIVAGDQAALYPAERPDVQAVVDQFGPMDLPGMGHAGVGSVTAMFGTAAPPAAALLSASPLPLVTAHAAPVYILHGTADHIVPFGQSRRLFDALRAAHVPVELVPYQGDHGFGGLTDAQVGALQVAALQWLVRQLQ